MVSSRVRIAVPWLCVGLPFGGLTTANAAEEPFRPSDLAIGVSLSLVVVLALRLLTIFLVRRRTRTGAGNGEVSDPRSDRLHLLVGVVLASVFALALAPSRPWWFVAYVVGAAAVSLGCALWLERTASRG